jgi:hypothetical protein
MSAAFMVQRTAEMSPQTKARIAGVFFLLILVVGIVPNIGTHVDAFRFSVVADDFVVEVQRCLQLAGLQGGAA